MSKHRLEIADLEVNSFSVSDADTTEPRFPSDISCNMWCTLAGACASWFICSDVPAGIGAEVPAEVDG